MNESELTDEVSKISHTEKWRLIIARFQNKLMDRRGL